jgi:hypothetical protein
MRILEIRKTCPCGKKVRPIKVDLEKPDYKDKLRASANIVECPKCYAKSNRTRKQAEIEYTINTPEYKAAREEYVLRRSRGEDVGNFQFP